MRRNTFIAGALLALSLQLVPQAAVAQDKQGKADAVAPKEKDPHTPFEELAHGAYVHMFHAKDSCDVAGYNAARVRLLGAIAAMRSAAKKAKKAGVFSKLDPEWLKTRAEDFESLIKIRDEDPWKNCPRTVQNGGHVLVPYRERVEDEPRESYAVNAGSWEAIERVSSLPRAGSDDREVAFDRDGFDRDGSASNTPLAMGEYAHRQARSGMEDRRYPFGTAPMEMPGGHQIDPRYPSGSGYGMPAGPRMPGFGGWGWGH